MPGSWLKTDTSFVSRMWEDLERAHGWKALISPRVAFGPLSVRRAVGSLIWRGLSRWVSRALRFSETHATALLAGVLELLLGRLRTGWACPCSSLQGPSPSCWHSPILSPHLPLHSLSLTEHTEGCSSWHRGFLKKSCTASVLLADLLSSELNMPWHSNCP